MVEVARRHRVAADFLYPAALAWTAWSASRARDRRLLRERLSGTIDASLQRLARPLWVHCASVGELNTATPLIRAQLAAAPELDIVVTTNTPTSAAVFGQKEFPENVAHRYLPLDYSRHCQKFLDMLEPRAAWIVETELWLNIFAECRRRDIPISIVSGRLSEKTMRAARLPLMKGYYRACMNQLTRILARAEAEADCFAELGAPRERIHVVGNLKYAFRPKAEYPRLISRPYLLASSTHAGEEEAVVRAFLNADGAAGHLLVVAPRHPDRADDIIRRLRAAHPDITIARRSVGDSFDDATVYIADTVGELHALIAHADFVFTGGSLAPIGGHNVLEPAALGTPQVVGPHIGSHSSEVATLRAISGIIEIPGAEELSEVFSGAVRGIYRRNAQLAAQLMRERQGILQAYVTMLAEDLAEPSSSD